MEDSLNGVLALVQELGPVKIPVDVQVALPELALDFQAASAFCGSVSRRSWSRTLDGMCCQVRHGSVRCR